ncbi:GNAT family N-acetyltransferase [Paenibacillus aceti]|uniref:N-acetyltransferase n=1 Tax=Paenibacillus aceti TaxID=1820010 RepID=A0ABQ1VUX5_9BACL|nr:GNAT family protein [Paenibacillus aceti]GGF99577.1 N-acetyltransferase [Paenibacillus aceti]
MYRCGGKIPVLEGERVRLRRMEQADAADLFHYWSDPKVVIYMNVPVFSSVEETAEMIDFLNGLSETEDSMRWGIELKQERRLIGSCGFNTWELSGAYRGEIGYDLGRAYWRQGYMTEALRLLLNHGFLTMGLNRIEALVDPRNEGSQKILEYFTFQNEGCLREYQRTGEGFVDLYLYSLLRREYEAVGKYL